MGTLLDLAKPEILENDNSQSDLRKLSADCGLPQSFNKYEKTRVTDVTGVQPNRDAAFGVTSLKLADVTGVTESEVFAERAAIIEFDKTAWFLVHRICEAMTAENRGLLVGNGGAVLF